MINFDIHSDKLVEYLEEHTDNESVILKELREYTLSQVPQANMLSGWYQGRFLSMISKIIQPKKILEIGTYTGYATLCLAEGLQKDGTITTIERNESMKEVYTPFFERSEYSKQINPLLIGAREFFKEDNTSYDLVFMDANKRMYTDYYENLVPNMPSGGVILADNTLWKLKVLDKVHDRMAGFLIDFNKHVALDKRVEKVIIPMRDGITMIRKI